MGSVLKRIKYDTTGVQRMGFKAFMKLTSEQRNDACVNVVTFFTHSQPSVCVADTHGLNCTEGALYTSVGIINGSLSAICRLLC
jgi:hypothetical protein